LNAELDAHLDREAGDEADCLEPALKPANRRNGTSPKTVLTGTLKVRLDIRFAVLRFRTIGPAPSIRS
jgi:hypothetical protein